MWALAMAQITVMHVEQDLAWSWAQRLEYMDELSRLLAKLEQECRVHRFWADRMPNSTTDMTKMEDQSTFPK